MTLGFVSVELYTPKPDELRSKLLDERAASKRTALVMLNISHANFNFCCSVIDHCFPRPVSIPK